MNTGRPDIDATYVVATEEPEVAQVLGEVLPGFAPFGQPGVHLVGDSTGVSFVMEKEGWPLVMLALDQVPVMKEHLAVLAQRVGGWRLQPVAPPAPAPRCSKKMPLGEDLRGSGRRAEGRSLVRKVHCKRTLSC